MTALQKTIENIKLKYPDVIVLLEHLGSYEVFGSDADTVSQVCGCTLTQPDGQSRTGFQRSSLEDYLHKLIAAGYKVGIVEPQ